MRRRSLVWPGLAARATFGAPGYRLWVGYTASNAASSDTGDDEAELGTLADDKPVKVTVELPAALHRDLVTYAEVLGRETGQSVGEPSRLIAPMLERFMATDRGFAKARRAPRGSA